MSTFKFSALPDRGAVSIVGADAGKLLQGLITNDVDLVDEPGHAIHAGLLSPQGKILFDFFVTRCDGGYLLDVAREKAPDLVKRLNMYRLRADAAISDVSNQLRVFARWGDDAISDAEDVGGLAFADPRSADLGHRLFAQGAAAGDLEATPRQFMATASAYHAHRITAGVPEGGQDYAFGDAFPHEAAFDLFNGVSFTKGCYVGQEVVARMQNKSVVRKRVVRIAGDAPLASGADILLGEIPIGRIGSTADRSALALLRLDRAVEAQKNSLRLTAGGVAITPDAAALNRYRASAAARPDARRLPS